MGATECRSGSLIKRRHLPRRQHDNDQPFIDRSKATYAFLPRDLILPAQLGSFCWLSISALTAMAVAKVSESQAAACFTIHRHLCTLSICARDNGSRMILKAPGTSNTNASHHITNRVNPMINATS